jgi:putative PEP-CTERM system TPR-repeat lipoprotein
LAAAQTLKQRMPDNPMPDNFLGTIYLGKKNPDLARIHFSKALEIQPKFTPAALNLAEIDRVSGKIAEARQRYRDVLERDPKHVQAMLRLAQIAFSEKENDAGIEWLQRAVGANSKTKQPRLRLVNALLQLRQNEQALSAARDLVRVAEKDPDALDALARAQIATGGLTNGLSTYRQLAGILPNSAIVRHRFGRALATAKNYQEASAQLDEAIKLAPNLIEARQDRIRVAYQQVGPEGALALATKMMKEAPKAAYGYLLQGDVHMKSGNFAAASAAYTTAQARKASPQTLARLYQSMLRDGKGARARDLLKDWLAQRPGDTSVRFMYASALIRSGEHAAAIRENETLLKKFPENAVLLNDLAWLYGKTNDTRALEFARRAHKRAPQSPAISDTLGWLLINHGDKKQGLELLKKARDGAPQELQIGYHYAAALSGAGRDADALKILKDILDTGKPFAGIVEARKLYARLATK